MYTKPVKRFFEQLLKYRFSLKAGIFFVLSSFFILFVSYYTEVKNFDKRSKAVGTNYYVDSVSGNDTNSGTSENSPWKSLSLIQAANLQPGDVINLKRGSVWTTGLYIDNSGTETDPIIFQAYGTGNSPIIEKPGSSSNWTSGIEIIANWVVIQDIMVRNAYYCGIKVGDQGSDLGQHVTINNCEVYNAGMGFAIWGQYNKVIASKAHDLTMVVNDSSPDNDFGATAVGIYNSNNEFAYNTFYNCRAQSQDYGHDGGGFEFYGTVNNNKIHHNWVADSENFLEIGGGSTENTNYDNSLYYNVVVNNFGMGYIHIAGGATSFGIKVQNLKIENNTFIETMADGNWAFIGFSANPPSTIYLRNNIFYLNNFSSFSNFSGFTHSHNLYYLTGNSDLNYTLGTGEILGQDPKFLDLDARDFRLQPTSPAKDKGISLGYTIDFEGETVPYSTAPDMGAFEYVDVSAISPTPTLSPTPTSTSSPYNKPIGHDASMFPSTKEYLIAGDYMRATVVRSPETREIPITRDSRWDTRITWLNAVSKPGVIKALTFSAVEDIENQIDYVPSDVEYIEYNLEGGMSPEVDLNNPANAVYEAAQIVHSSGKKLAFGPIRAAWGSFSTSDMQTILTSADAVAIQEQVYIEGQGNDMDIFAADVLSWKNTFAPYNPNIKLFVQLWIGRQTPEQISEGFIKAQNYFDIGVIGTHNLNDADNIISILQDLGRGTTQPVLTPTPTSIPTNTPFPTSTTAPMPTPTGSPIGWWNDDWNYRFKFDIDNSQLGANLVDFPLNINLSNAPSGFWDNIKSDGSDIRIINEDGTDLTSQSHLENWNSPSRTGQLWVKRNIQSSGDSEYLYVYYGNPNSAAAWNESNTYNPNYKAVWHMSESSGTRYDSTVNSNNLTDNNTVGTGSGIAGNAADFESSSTEYFSIADASQTALEFNGNYTIEAWINIESIEDFAIIDKKKTQDPGSQDEGFEFSMTYNTDDFYLAAEHMHDWSTSRIRSDISYTQIGSGWHQVALIFNNLSKLITFCLDGSCEPARTQNITSTGNDQPLWIGNSQDWEHKFDGKMDEIRISANPRSTEWIKFAYKSDSGDAGTAQAQEEKTGPQIQIAVNFGDVLSGQPPGNVLLEFYQNSSLAASYESNDLINEGLFTPIITNLPYGTYDVYVKGWAHLRKRVASGWTYTGNEENADWSNQKLIAGDVYGNDNVLEMGDVTAMLNAWTESEVAVESTNKIYDLNLDGHISMSDVTMIITNWTVSEVHGD